MLQATQAPQAHVFLAGRKILPNIRPGTSLERQVILPVTMTGIQSNADKPKKSRSRRSARPRTSRPTFSELRPEIASLFEPVLTVREYAAVTNQPVGSIYAQISNGTLQVIYPAPKSPRIRLSVAKAALGEHSESKVAS